MIKAIIKDNSSSWCNMVIALWMILALVPCLLGMGVTRCFYGRDYRSACGKGVIFLHGFCVWIGIAEVAHLGAVFLKQSVTWMAVVLWGLTAFLCIVSVGMILFERKRKEGKRIVREPETAGKNTVQILAGILGLSVIFQVIMIMAGPESYRDGDMTLETVQTFLTQNAIYQANPLTGRAYEGGIPLRLKILCLPSLYAASAKLTGVDVSMIVGGIFPVVVLIGSYLSYGSLAKVLFKKDKRAQLVMLILVSVLIWCGDYMVSMDGFQLLHCGYRPTAVRGGILVPFTLSMCLQKKWKSAILAILAEACIVWTLYGMGVCLFMTVVMLLLHLAAGRMEGRKCRNS